VLHPSLKKEYIYVDLYESGKQKVSYLTVSKTEFISEHTTNYMAEK